MDNNQHDLMPTNKAEYPLIEFYTNARYKDQTRPDDSKYPNEAFIYDRFCEFKDNHKLADDFEFIDAYISKAVKSNYLKLLSVKPDNIDYKGIPGLFLKDVLRLLYTYTSKVPVYQWERITIGHRESYDRDATIASLLNSVGNNLQAPRHIFNLMYNLGVVDTITIIFLLCCIL